jgi:hypothetical protein
MAEPPDTDDLIASKRGYATYIITDTDVSEGISHFIIELDSGSGTVVRPEVRGQGTGDITEEADESPTSILPAFPAAFVEWLGQVGKPRFLGADGSIASTLSDPPLVIPSSIRVGINCPTRRIVSAACPSVGALPKVNKCITADCSKRCPVSLEAMSLDTYVKGGLNNEWPKRWHENALRAGAVAYRSYGAYWALRRMTAPYDIRSDICHQVWDEWTSPQTDAAVDFTAGVVLVEGASIVKAEYAAETTDGACPSGQTGEATSNWPCMKDSLCAGATFYGHGRGMCQWGSQRWATGKNAAGVVVTTPRSWECILDHYYNDNGNSMGKGTGKRRAFLYGAERRRGIAFMSDRDDPDISDAAYEIYVMNADGSGQTRLTTNVMLADVEPSWSPDGMRIAFVSDRADPTFTFDIYVMNADGSSPTRITTNPARNYWPSCKGCLRFE